MSALGHKQTYAVPKRYFRFASESRHKIRYFVSSTIVTDGVPASFDISDAR
jgi:hypothetical protein